MAADRHSLLRRQIKRLFGAAEAAPPQFDPLLEAVDEAYRQSDTDRRMLERSLDLSSQELLERNTELRTLFQALPDLLFRLDRDGTILNVKAGAHEDLVLEPSRLIGKNIRRAPVRLEDGRSPFEALFDGTEPGPPGPDHDGRAIEYSLELCGETRFYEARVVTFMRDQMLLIVRNVTMRTRAESALRQANELLEQRVTARTTELRRSNEQLRGEIAEREDLEARMIQTQKLEGLGILAGGIAHDFNNLLMGVLGNASLALTSVDLDSETHDRLLEIQQAAERASELTNQMLAYSGRGTCVVRPTDLNLLVRETAGLLNASISNKARMVFELGHDLPAIEADATQLRQMVMNLIINASDALEGRSGTIVVRTGWRRVRSADLARTYLAEPLPEGRYAVLEVVDTGSGMSPETLERLFDPFYTTKFAGRGLGLAAALGIVRGHRGAIRVESEPERGSTFTVFFPAAIANAGRTELPSEKAGPGWHGSGRVLVIDDDRTVLSVMRSMLERCGMTPLLAESGPRGLELLRRFRSEIDCVFLDLTMPAIEGPEVFEQIRRVDARLPVVVMSGYARDEAIGRFPGGALAGFLHKPFDSRTLERQLRSIIRPRTRPPERAVRDPTRRRPDGPDRVA